MIKISKVINGVSYYTDTYDKFDVEVKWKMYKLRLEDDVDKVNAEYNGQLIAFTNKDMNYIRVTDLGESIYEFS